MAHRSDGSSMAARMRFVHARPASIAEEHGAGAIILFEANATMNFFPLSDDPQYAYLGKALARAQRAFDTLLFGEKF
jgi:hypothetical protein